MEVKLEFCGGAESHNNGEKIMTMQFPEDTSLRDIFRMLRGGDVSTLYRLSRGSLDSVVRRSLILPLVTLI